MLKLINMKRRNLNQQGGFVQLIVLIILILLFMRHFNLTISGSLGYFNLTIGDVVQAAKNFFYWFLNLLYSVR